MYRTVSGVSLARKIVSHPGIVQLYIDVQEQAEDDTINEIQLQQQINNQLNLTQQLTDAFQYT